MGIENLPSTQSQRSVSVNCCCVLLAHISSKLHQTVTTNHSNETRVAQAEQHVCPHVQALRAHVCSCKPSWALFLWRVGHAEAALGEGCLDTGSQVAASRAHVLGLSVSPWGGLPDTGSQVAASRANVLGLSVSPTPSTMHTVWQAPDKYWQK